MGRFFVVIIVLLSVDPCLAGIFDNLKIDCGVSIWSRWRKSGNGFLTRNRTIWRQDQHGGKPCPHTVETDTDPWAITDPKVKTSKIATSFLSMVESTSGVYKRKRASRSGDTIRPRDFLYVIDMSGSVGRTTFNAANAKLSQLIGKICGDVGLLDTNNRVAAITYSNTVVENFDFDRYSSTPDVQNAIENLPFKGGSTCTGKALNYAKTMFDPTKGARSDVASVKEVVLLTDGKWNCASGTDPVQAALELRGLPPPKTVFVFAIGANFDQDDITAMSTSPPSNHVFSFSSFTEFGKVVDDVLTFPGTCVPIVVGK